MKKQLLILAAPRPDYGRSRSSPELESVCRPFDVALGQGSSSHQRAPGISASANGAQSLAEPQWPLGSQTRHGTDTKILVPYPVESALSGVMKHWDQLSLNATMMFMSLICGRPCWPMERRLTKARTGFIPIVLATKSWPGHSLSNVRRFTRQSPPVENDRNAWA